MPGEETVRWRGVGFSLAFFLCSPSSVIAQPGAPVEIVPQIEHGNVITSNAFSPDGKLTLTTSHDNTARLWDAETGVLLRSFSGNGAAIYGGAFTPDGQHALTGGHDRAIRMWETSSGKLVKTLIDPEPHGIVRAIAHAPNGKHAFAGTIHTAIRVWDLSTGKLASKLSGHTSSVNTLSLSKDGTRLLRQRRQIAHSGGCAGKEADPSNEWPQRHHCRGGDIAGWFLIGIREQRRDCAPLGWPDWKADPHSPAPARPFRPAGHSREILARCRLGCHFS
jgi:hypothetical protein